MEDVVTLPHRCRQCQQGMNNAVVSLLPFPWFKSSSEHIIAGRQTHV